MSLSFELPPRLNVVRESALIYQVAHPILSNPNSYAEGPSGDYADAGNILGAQLDSRTLEEAQQYWQQQLKKLNAEFKITGPVQEADDRLLLGNERYNLHVYKASDSFLYFDRTLVSPTDPVFSEKLISAEAALQKTQLKLRNLGLFHEYLEFRGIGYTGVSVDDSTPDNPHAPSEEYKTEIKVHYRFKLNGLPVFGPGAKIVASYAGEELSQMVYFWRTPALVNDGSAVSAPREVPIISAQAALDAFSQDPRFVTLKKGNAKVRFHELQLGYYAPSPQVVQTALYPVYQVKGTVETWQMGENSFADMKDQLSGDVFRSHFTLHILAAKSTTVQENGLYKAASNAVANF